MQDKDKLGDIDSLVSEILSGRTRAANSNSSDVDSILAGLAQPPHDDMSSAPTSPVEQAWAEAALAKAPRKVKAQKITDDYDDNNAVVEPPVPPTPQKTAKIKAISEEFASTFAPVERATRGKKQAGEDYTQQEDNEYEAPTKEAAKPHISLRERMMQVMSSMPTDDEYDDYEDSESTEDLENSDNIEDTPSKGPCQDEDTSAGLSHELPTLELPALETPTVEFSKQDLKAGARHKAGEASFVLRPESEKYSKKSVNPILANEVDDAFREFFGETVAVDRDELEKGLKGKKAGKVLHNIFGARSAETGSFDVQDEEADELEEEYYEGEIDSGGEYTSPQDAQDVAATLKNMRSTATLRVIATALTTLLLLYLGLSSRTGLLPPIPALDPSVNPLLFLCVNLGLLFVTAVVSITALSSGLIGLVKDASCDTMPAMATVAALIQNLYFIFAKSEYSPSTVTLFAPIACVLLCANAIGKRMHCAVVCRNFDMISVGHDHSAAYLVKNREIVERVCLGLGTENEPQLLVSRPTALVKGFVKQSFSSARGEHTAKIMSYIILAAGVSGAIISFATVGTLSAMFTGLAATLCFASPFASSILYALPCALSQRSAARVGAVVPGWSSIEALGSASAVTVGARDLFPASTVRLHGIKTFEKERIDLAILYAASVLIEGCDTLRDIFLGVIENKTDMLYKVESLSQETGYGFTAWIEHSRVIVGSRDMMLRHDIEIPSLDYEMKYTKDERCPIYLAVSGKLFGMFLVSYCADDDAYDVAQNLRHSGIAMMVRSDDFNISSELITKAYDLPAQFVKVLTAEDRDALAPSVAYLPESEGVMTHIGTFSSFLGGLHAAAGAESGVKMSSIVQCASIVLGIIISLLLCFTGGIVSMSLTAVILYSLAWAALTVLMPFLKRY